MFARSLLVILSTFVAALLVVRILDGAVLQNLWIDEVANLMRTWLPGDLWLKQVSILEVLYLAPIRISDGLNPEGLLRTYKVISALFCLGALIPYFVYCAARRYGISLALMISIGLFSTHWLTSYFAIARPTGVAIMGLAIWLVAPESHKGRLLTYMAMLMQPFAHGFYLLHQMAVMRVNWKTKVWGAGIALVFSAPVFLGVAEGRSILMDLPFVREIGREFAAANKVHFASFLAEPFLGVTVLPIVAICIVYIFVHPNKWWDVAVIPVYAALLELMDALGLPVFTRYIFPVWVWTWCRLFPGVFGAFARRTVLSGGLILLVIVQTMSLPPRGAHWEAAKFENLGLPPLHPQLCRFHLESESPLVTLNIMDLLLARGLWHLDSGANSSIECGVSLKRNFWHEILQEGESRFVSVFVSAERLNTACVIHADSFFSAEYRSKQCLVGH